ncbi:hypothetical protein Cgig2_031024 [Carnegiea gigantea]|uniref:Protein TILLER ANGLE CONTROL 1 n=1 Tax=Carnegiea gigantea TaxID=171969 RepID=A0A9Q1QFV1_9CARY|nr:hypothetical protein Cgig2_031024 [Carnegiea gigantea]
MQEDGKTSSKKVDFEKNDLLEHDGHDEVNNWEKGFLAIGTLGLGPLDERIQPQCYDEIIKEILGDHDHHHKENSLVLGDHLHADDKDDEHDNLRNHEILLFRHELEKSGSRCDEIEEVTEDNVNVEMKEDNQSKKTEIRVRKRRVTLADLLSEDPDHHVLHIEEEVEDECHVQHNSTAIQKPNKIKKKTTRAKNSFIKAKKLLKDDFRPIDMCNQMLWSNL